MAPGQRLITATAPVRICDLGGWTDTWFGGPGRVLNIAVGPAVRAEIGIEPGRGETRFRKASPMLTAAARRFPAPQDADLTVDITSAVPPGASTGTSAAVLVAVLMGLATATGHPIDPREAARQAHLVETEDLGGESGLQDQMAAVHGGISWISIDDYPHVTTEPLPAWPALDDHLTTVYLGLPHSSSAVHQEVIAGHREPTALDDLRAAAELGRRAVIAQDAELLAEAMTANTAAQGRLHPALVGSEARRLWSAAQKAGASGWKVNGAGGPGGTVTFISADPGIKARVERAIDGGFILPLRYSDQGVRVEALL